MAYHKWEETDKFWTDFKLKVYETKQCAKCGDYKLIDRNIKKGQWEFGNAWYAKEVNGEMRQLRRVAGECKG